ncbi:ATP citrate lyase citrate-binding domain-containing protein [Methanothrix harundinacea]|uniref:ATP citrate synthase n=2 Tax=Methanothrix harundinacea TaxID=301375 RepID=G7WP48_METH6|nr:ATP citrate lyase citrate-binding domain-containing protein [Methanothrix harundinacea]ADQ42387.1 ATP-citrate lyase subunit B [Methanothrix harundinacea 6Ac]AET64889.1 ATP-citrate lyase subunit B [Methanothrix harundinacea 6Ac]
MAQRGIREYDAKKLLAERLPDYADDFDYDGQIALVTPETDLEVVAIKNPWVKKKRLVVKPDQLFGKRGAHGLILLDASWDEAKGYIQENMGREVLVGSVVGTLDTFLIEPFIPHGPEEELYVAIKSERDKDVIYFSPRGGVDIEANWESVTEIPVDILARPEELDLGSKLPAGLADRLAPTAAFIKGLYRLYRDLGFAYLEINPFVFTDGRVVPLDLVARLDDAEAFWQRKAWLGLEFPEPFGRALTEEEAWIKEIDSRTGASLKLTILNPRGRVWTMVAGGGASVIYADTICDLGFAGELANYGEYSGDPSTEDTYEYTKTILDLMTREEDPEGRPKYLLIGGGIANFTDVAKTFKGVVMALEDYKERLREAGVEIYVRRGGPNYEEGLRIMRKLGERLGVPIHVYGPETHMTRIVSMALGGGE